jgi:hypothetical protein
MRSDTSLRSKLSEAAGWIMAGCGLITVVVVTALVSSIDTALGAALLFAGLLAGGFLSIAAHELGHAAGAWLVGWRVWIVSVLGVVVRPGHAPRLSTKLSHDVGGYVLASPPDAARDGGWRSIVFSAGGPLASVLTGPLFIFWLATLPRDGWDTPLGAGVLGSMLSFGVAGASAALMTLWPSRGRDGRPNDMTMILEALSERAEPADARGVAWAWSLFEHGVEPSALPQWMRESVARSANNPWASPAAPLIAFASALQAGDEAAARKAAQLNAGDIGKLMRAFVSAYFDGDAQAAETQLAGLAIDPREETLLLFRAFIDARVLSLRGDPNGKARMLAVIADELQSGGPKPFWERLLERSA